MSVPMLRETTAFELAQRMAGAFAKSNMVPDALKDNMPNCLTAMMLAEELGESTMMVLNSIYFVHGRPSFLTKFMIARANRMGVFSGPLRWTDGGDNGNPSETCFGDLAGVSGDARVEITIDLKTAIESGWTKYRDKQGKEQTHARWATPAMQRQMLRWRTASWLINLYAPNCMLGIPTREELEDISGAEMRDVTPPKPTIDDFVPGTTMTAEPTDRPHQDEVRDPPGDSRPMEADRPDGGEPDRAIPPEPAAPADPPRSHTRRVPRQPKRAEWVEISSSTTHKQLEAAGEVDVAGNEPNEPSTEFVRLREMLGMETTRTGIERWQRNNEIDIRKLKQEEADFRELIWKRMEALP